MRLELLALCWNAQESQVQTPTCRSLKYLHFRRAYGTLDGFSSGPIIPRNSMATWTKDMAICHHAWQENHSRLDRHSLRSSRAVGKNVNEEGSWSFFSFLCLRGTAHSRHLIRSLMRKLQLYCTMMCVGNLGTGWAMRRSRACGVGVPCFPRVDVLNALKRSHQLRAT